MNQSNELDGMLYFAQRLQEAVFYYTVDIYKSPLLNTHQLAREYIKVHEAVETETMNKAHLDEIKNEFLYSIDHDVVLKKYWGEESISQIKNKINTQSFNEVKKTMHYLTTIWGKGAYYRWCVDYLKSIVVIPKEKKKIEQGLRCWLPELYACGYSNQYIYRCLKKTLFEHRPRRLSDFEDFISIFDRESHNFKVYLAVKKEILVFKDLLLQNNNVSFDDDGNFSRINCNSKYVVFSVDNIRELDEYNAVTTAKAHLTLILMIYMALDNKKRIEIFKTAVVKSEDSYSFISTNENYLYSIEKFEPTEAAALVKDKLLSLIAPCIDRDTLFLVTRIFEKHNFAISESNISNGFLNLWSILEMFSASIDDGTKIEKIRKSVLVMISNNYYKRVLLDLSKNMKAVLMPEKYLQYMSKVTNIDDEVTKLAHIVFLEEYSDVRTEINSALERNPNLRSRISQLNQLGGNVKYMHANLIGYKERVSWHLSRMYRCRNSIIHSGKTDDMLNSLTEHLHSYVDILIYELVDCLSGCHGLSNIDDIILLHQLKEERLVKKLYKDLRIDKEIIELILH